MPPNRHLAKSRLAGHFAPLLPEVRSPHPRPSRILGRHRHQPQTVLHPWQGQRLFAKMSKMSINEPSREIPEFCG